MYQNKKVAVLIAAAGSGKRMGSGISKQYRKIGDLPMLSKTIGVFEEHPLVDSIYVIAKKDELEECREKLIAPFGFQKVKGLVAGGNQRQDSVYAGLSELADEELILIHDGARPFVSDAVIQRVIETTSERGAAVAAVPVKDTIKVSDGEIFTDTPKRSELYAVQTPQGFERNLICRGFRKAFDENFYGTDDAVLVERCGEKVYLVKGDYRNIKITTPEDLQAEETKMLKIGTGFDVHRLVENRKLILGGVEIPYEKGLLGHSDADVLLHAIIDALLGAAGLGDIGRHFPDSDPNYRGIDSGVLLSQVQEMIEEKGFSISNVDATVIAQQPKIAPYIDEMEENISRRLKIPRSGVNVKGTTTEGLGYTGRGEGVAAQASVILIR